MNYSNTIESIESKSLKPESEDILPLDTITCSEWNENDNMKFGVTSFDGTFRLYEIVSQNNQTYFRLLNLFKYKFPLTSFTFLGKSEFVAIGTCDGKVILVKMEFSESKEILNFEELGSHPSHLMKLFYVAQLNSLVSVDTSQSIKIWDLEKLEVSDLSLIHI